MLGTILDESSPPPYKEMPEKSDDHAPEKLPYFGERDEEKFGQPKKVEAAAGEEATNDAEEEEFGHRFAKFWPFRLLKTINLVSKKFILIYIEFFAYFLLYSILKFFSCC